MALRKANQESQAPVETKDEGADAGVTTVDKAVPMFDTPPFEDDVQTEVVAPEKEVAAAKEVASTAIAKAKSTAVGAASKIKGAFGDLQNAIELDTVESLGVGAFPRVTVDLGGFMIDKDEIGTEIKLELLSWNYRYMVTTGANDEEAKKKVKVSYDGETIIGTGESVADAIAAFKEEGYEDAERKMYVDLWGSLCSKNGVDLDEADRPLVQVQLSPESVKKFKAFQVELGFKQARGLVSDTPTIVIKSQRGEWKGNRFGYCTFGLK